MYNDHLALEEAQKMIEQRIQEAEACRQQKLLGHGNSGATRWVLLLVVIIVVVVVSVLL